jgi:hypothetical protein
VRVPERTRKPRTTNLRKKRKRGFWDYRATKAWERGNKYERVKPLDGIQLVKIQPGQRRSGQAGSESGTGVGRPTRGSVDSEGAGRGIELRNLMSWRMPTSLIQRKAASREPRGEGLVEPPESKAGARSQRDSPRTWEASSSPSPYARVPRGQGQPETTGTAEEESYEPVVPGKVGNRRASAPTGGKGRTAGRPE